MMDRIRSCDTLEVAVRTTPLTKVARRLLMQWCEYRQADGIGAHHFGMIKQCIRCRQPSCNSNYDTTVRIILPASPK